ncbi:hypothetical protein [Thermosulfurimonas sp. F29]|uniref:hypothetical protein n=1 Tax=Thermosulfurimonas sp. F29 TaxID=2867247 RepID=UPI001C83E4BD|nr:hypothetical protein [Thermosulfurimonas sp. F29]MBX6423145.1 hypothetical protein [Thermosulfurimonas sp. F29]
MSGLSFCSLALLILGLCTALVVFFLVKGIPSGIGDYLILVFIGVVLSILMVLDHTYALERLRLGEQKGRDEHTGVSGYRRSIMAIGLILIFGWVLFRLLQRSDELSRHILQNAVGLLEGILATLTGFYFGGRGGLKIRKGGEG